MLPVSIFFRLAGIASSGLFYWLWQAHIATGGGFGSAGPSKYLFMAALVIAPAALAIFWKLIHLVKILLVVLLIATVFYLSGCDTYDSHNRPNEDKNHSRFIAPPSL